MPKTTVRALDIKQPGNSLAVWLAKHHPDLFVAAFKKAQQAQAVKGLGQLADGLSFDFEPALQSISLDPIETTIPSNFLSDATDIGSSFLSSIGNGFTSAGSTIGDVVSSAGSGILGALGSVGSYLGSAQGLTSMTGLAKTYFQAQAADSTAQTQQAVLAAQIARAQTGVPAAPITYTTNAQGQVVPVYATQSSTGTIYQPLSQQGLASLTPSSFSVFLSRYGLWIGVGAVGLIALARLRGQG